ncbi:hypothetical protein YPC_4868 (plasmid) [Yersinia pestis biovar Medievalis str. Harbin 35]|nr:hypothetical protein YPC_4868 [Yersinia pestis biovar Medievalis str. Harbin 35]EEO83430.1 hypothetical protein YPH_4833 [Yersinia pestis biovar Orientalis str. PEXU2]EEO88120.1 hypothetical protein YPS_4888 [Yersinia pestis Pestoides A]
MMKVVSNIINDIIYLKHILSFVYRCVNKYRRCSN